MQHEFLFDRQDIQWSAKSTVSVAVFIAVSVANRYELKPVHVF